MTSALKATPNIDVAEIKIDTKRSTMRPLHAKSLKKVHSFLSSSKGKQIIANGWKASGITDAVRDARSAEVRDLLDPFAALAI